MLNIAKKILQNRRTSPIEKKITPIKEILTAKIRYRTKDAICRLIEKNKNSLIVEFNEPQFAITPGQSIVFYDREICLGGAVIETRTHSIN